MSNVRRLAAVGLIISLIYGFCLAGTAVSQPNGKIGISGGKIDSENAYNLEGSFSTPLGPNAGLQVDAMYSDVSEMTLYGAGMHLFWRDSETGLFGISGGVMRDEGMVDSWSAGLEAEYYLERLTLGAQGGAANIRLADGPFLFIESDKTGYFATGSIGIYPIEELLISASYTHVLDNGLGRMQIEYQTPYNGLSLFGDAAVGNYNYDHVIIGMRYYFGSNKSLISRHREDDPQNSLHNAMHTIGTYRAEFYRKDIGERQGTPD